MTTSSSLWSSSLWFWLSFAGTVLVLGLSVVFLFKQPQPTTDPSTPVSVASARSSTTTGAAQDNSTNESKHAAEDTQPQRDDASPSHQPSTGTAANVDGAASI